MPLNAQQESSISYNASTSNSWVTGDAAYSADLSFIQQGTIYSYISQPAIYHCPSDRSLVISSNVLRTRSYSLNFYLNGGLDSQYTNGQPAGTLSSVISRYSEILHPSQIFAFLDENENTIEDGVYLLYRAPLNTWQNAPSDRHNQGINFTFTDGHVEHWHWLYPKQMQGLGATAVDPADIQDLRRLQADLANPL
jgi:prepilin-type processing-associated H-X9-DG protein